MALSTWIDFWIKNRGIYFFLTLLLKDFIDRVFVLIVPATWWRGRIRVRGTEIYDAGRKMSFLSHLILDRISFSWCKPSTTIILLLKMFFFWSVSFYNQLLVCFPKLINFSFKLHSDFKNFWRGVSIFIHLVLLSNRTIKLLFILIVRVFVILMPKLSKTKLLF